MNACIVIAKLHQDGFTPHIDSTGSLRLRGKMGAMTDEIRAMVKEHKDAIIAHMQSSPGLRPITVGEAAGIDLAFGTLKKQHGKELHAAGWTRPVIFDGLDPTLRETADDVPGIIGLLMAGGRVVAIHPDRIDLEFPDGVQFSKIRGGCLLGGKALDDFLCTRR